MRYVLIWPIILYHVCYNSRQKEVNIAQAFNLILTFISYAAKDFGNETNSSQNLECF